MRTAIAVTGWPPSRLGCTEMQVPAVTSVSAACVASDILVEGLKPTVVLPFSVLLT
jgi:hypothetical protein